MKQRRHRIAPTRFRIRERCTLQGQRIRPRAILVIPQENLTVGLKRIDRHIRGEEIIFIRLFHKRILAQQHRTVINPLRIHGHCLRNPVSIGKLFERIKVRELHHGNHIQLHRLAPKIRNLDIAQHHIFTRWHKDRNIGPDAIKLRHNPLISQSNVTLIQIVCIQRRNKERREHLIPIPLFDPNV